MIWILFWKADNPAFKVACFIYNVVYRKIPIISPGAYFWSKGLFQKFFLEGLILGGGCLYMDKYMYMYFENTIFCSSNYDFLRFSAYNMSLLLIFFNFFIFNNVLTIVSTILYS